MSFAVYRSSAGSGKTFTLVKEYLKLVLASERHDYYKTILAITFTNKAAGEMKERVLSTLESFAENKLNSSQQFMLGVLAGELGIDKRELQLRAGNVLRSVLHNYSDFHITTIDKFVHRIIRSFAFDLRIPMNFEVELDGQTLMADAVDVLLSRAGTEEELTKVLVDFCESRADDEGNWNIETDLRRYAYKLLEEDGHNYIAKLKHLELEDFRRIRKQLHEKIISFEKQLSSIGKKALTLVGAQGIPYDSFANGENGICKYFQYLEELRDDKLTPSSTVAKNVDQDKWTSAKCSPADKKAIEGIKEELLALYNEAAQLLEKDGAVYNLNKIINARIYSISLLNEIEKIISEFRSDENRIHISEFNKRISEVVSREPAPYIYERVGEKFRHFLIDEFQDTSELQWHNLLPLIENSLGSGYFNMVVGDGKQAIYRFRGGEVKQFAMLPQLKGSDSDPLTREKENTLKRNYKPEILGRNFRSKHEIVTFNNELFRYLSGSLAENYKSIYNDLEQKSDPENTGGFITLDLLDATAETHKEDALNLLTYQIQQALEDGYSPDDISIITRFNRDGTLIAEHLHSLGYSVSSSESLVLPSSEVVRFLVSVLYFLEDSSSGIAKAEIIDYLHRKVHRNEALRTFPKLSADKFISHIKDIGYPFDPAGLRLKSLYETCEDLIRIFMLDDQDPYLLSFLDHVLQFNMKHNKGISAFLVWWEEKKHKLSIDGSGISDAVRIMSIHKSKGLEFPVVICPFMNWTQGTQKDDIWTDSRHSEVEGLPVFLLPAEKKIEATAYHDLYQEEKEKSGLDDLNILYVAFTRAVERLYIISSFPHKSGNLSKHFIGYLEHKNVFSESVPHYEFGKRIKTSVKKKQISAQMVLNGYPRGPWSEVVEISRESLKLTEEGTSKITLGKLVHQVLSEIDTLDQVPQKLRRLFEDGMISRESLSELERKINVLVAKTNLSELFLGGRTIRTETDILLPGGRFIRPDRVITDGVKATIVDYKTGKKRESDVEQVNNYAEILSKMGYRDIKKYLVYIGEEELVEV